MNNKTIVLTGASGFLGKYIQKELSKTSDVLTISRKGGNININIATDVPKLPSANLVVHCAGKAHSIPKTEKEKQSFFDVNVKGTANLLEGIKNSGSMPNGFVFISTVAVYGCELGTMINENHPLNASDPYGLSKIQAERLIEKWCVEHNVICTILRLPLLVGENPPGNLGAMIKGIDSGYYFNIAGGKAKKSMVFAEDVAKIIPTVANIGGIFNITDGCHPSFEELSSKIADKLKKRKPLNIPLWLAGIMGRIGNLLGNKAPINTSKLKKITADLTFDDSKAKERLNWSPLSVIDHFRL